MFNKKGFTLIELLVVVLIIGILAAIAVPQYQKAVKKSRLSQAFILLKAIDDAQKVYFLANGKYSTKFADLDISIQGIKPSGDTDWISHKDFSIYQYIDGGKSFSASMDDSSRKLPRMEKYYDADFIICWYNEDNTKKDLCTSLTVSGICNDNYCELR